MANIKDVAKKAGVSITTVSRAFNGYPDISEETRKKIIEVAHELSYRPNAVARSLVKKESRTFGYIVSGLDKKVKHTIIQDTLCGIYDYAGKIDYEILMFTVDSKKQLKKSYMQFAKEHSLSGIIIQGLRTDDEYYQEVMRSKLPCVLIDIKSENNRAGSVSIDNISASSDAVDLLIKNGHKNIAFVNGKIATSVSKLRLEGYLRRIKEENIEINDKYIITANFSETEAYEKMLKFIPDNPEVTAVFCASDLMAIGAMKAIEELGKRVPEDIAVIGFDDILISGYTKPTLTTVHQDFYKMGFEASEMLYKIVKNNIQPYEKITPYEIIIRQST